MTVYIMISETKNVNYLIDIYANINKIIQFYNAIFMTK